MNPLPAPPAADPGAALPALPAIGRPPAATPNQTACRSYPWLLAFSTTVAALFCYLYLTKPLLVPPPAPGPATTRLHTPPAGPATPPARSPEARPTADAPLLPAADRLPGDGQAPAGQAAVAARPDLPPPTLSPFEETNLKVQHILTAEAPGGFLARINIDVPVLYQSRNLRWTPAEVAEARALLLRLTDYQEKSRQLRAEGTSLLETWTRLVGRSLPGSDLRADSPSLTANQEDAALQSPAAGEAPETIEITPADP